MSKEIDAVLFDMDGILIDSVDVIYNALNETSKKYAGETIGKDSFKEKHWGTKVEITVNNRWGDEAEEYYYNQILEYLHKAKLIDGIEEVLESLQKKKGVVTNGTREYTDMFLSEFDLKKYFDVIISADDVDNAKPSSDPILKACEILGVKPEDVVFLGDTDNDTKAARSAGCIMVGMGTDGDYKIESMRDFPKLLSKIQNS